jgi:hypothetical protein
MRVMRALLATLLGLAPAAHAAALTCTELAGRTFGPGFRRSACSVPG